IHPERERGRPVAHWTQACARRCPVEKSQQRETRKQLGPIASSYGPSVRALFQAVPLSVAAGKIPPIRRESCPQEADQLESLDRSAPPTGLASEETPSVERGLARCACRAPARAAARSREFSD